MLFRKNKNVSFPKEKLSALALDHFVEKYCGDNLNHPRKLSLHNAIWRTSNFFC